MTDVGAVRYVGRCRSGSPFARQRKVTSTVPPGRCVERPDVMFVTSISFPSLSHLVFASDSARFRAPGSPPRAGAACTDREYVSGPIFSAPLDCAQAESRSMSGNSRALFIWFSPVAIVKPNLKSTTESRRQIRLARCLSGLSFGQVLDLQYC